MNSLISIIIPVFNAQETVKMCIDSITAQTYKNLEIIIVNDGSTDSSADIIDEYKREDSRIKVIHKKNGGVSETRNVGIRRAKGKYVGFVDADDWIERDMYETLLREILIHNADFVCCSFFYEANSATKEIINYDKNKQFKGQAIIEEFLNGGLDGSVCNKLFKKESLVHLFDENIIIAEDFYFLFQVVLNSDLAIYLTTPLYHYVFNEDSASAAVVDINRIASINVAKKICMELTEKLPDLRDNCKIMLFKRMYAIFNMLVYHHRSHITIQHLPKIYRDIKELVNSMGKVDRRTKIKIIAFRLFRINRYIYRLLIKQYYRNKNWFKF